MFMGTKPPTILETVRAVKERRLREIIAREQITTTAKGHISERDVIVSNLILELYANKISQSVLPPGHYVDGAGKIQKIRAPKHLRNETAITPHKPCFEHKEKVHVFADSLVMKSCSHDS